jgi:hypothetical protein
MQVITQRYMPHVCCLCQAAQSGHMLLLLLLLRHVL